MADDERPLQQKVDDAIDEWLLEALKGAASSVWLNVSGGEPVDEAMEHFGRAVTNIKWIHKRAADAVKGQFQPPTT